MTKYHINPETGNPNLCKAVHKCKYATNGATPEHYGSKEEARAAYEKQMKENNLQKIRKQEENRRIAEEEKRQRFEKMEEQIRYSEKMKNFLQQRYENNKPEIKREYYPLAPEKIKEYNDLYSKLEKELTEEEKEAVKKYTAIHYEPINQFLFSENPEEYVFNTTSQEINDQVEKRIKAYIENLDSFIEKAPKQKKTVYRVFSQDMSEHFTGSEEFAEEKGYQIGKKIKFSGYSSTSIDPDYIAKRGSYDEHSNIVFVIDTNQGAPVDYIKENKDDYQYVQDSEKEILLPRNIEFKITKIERTRFYNAENEYTEPLTVFLEEA